MPRRLTQDDFISRSRAIHGDKYGYDCVKYVNSYTPVEIVCSVHGVIRVKPQTHLKGCGCQKCYWEDRKVRQFTTTEEYIRKARLVHGDKYDYSKTNFIRHNQKIIITCPIHGDFEQDPGTHLDGAGCQKCGRMSHIKKMSHDKEWFVAEANKVHNHKYTYEHAVYTRREDKITITCPVHGDFRQKADTHLAGHGCPRCFNDAKSKRLKAGAAAYMAAFNTKSTEQFIKDARKVHGDFYNYDKVVYTGVVNKVTITCPIHGDFEQQAAAHLQGHCCPHCRETIGERKVSLYLLRHNIKNKIQHRFYYKDEDGKRRYFVVDFWLKSRKIVIEFNGRQHYKATPKFGGEKQLVKQKQRDERLRKYCKSKGYYLIEIPYTKMKKTEEILDNALR